MSSEATMIGTASLLIRKQNKTYSNVKISQPEQAREMGSDTDHSCLIPRKIPC